MGNPFSQLTTVSVTKYALSLSDILYFSDIYFYFTPIFLHRTRYKRALAVSPSLTAMSVNDRLNQMPCGRSVLWVFILLHKTLYTRQNLLYLLIYFQHTTILLVNYNLIEESLMLLLNLNSYFQK